MADEKDYFEESPEDAGVAEAGDADGSLEASAEPVEQPAEPVEQPDAVTPEESAIQQEASPKNWYIIHTYSGFENKVQESLRTRAEAFGFADKIGQILIPTEEVVELRNGKKVTRWNSRMP